MKKFARLLLVPFMIIVAFSSTPASATPAEDCVAGGGAWVPANNSSGSQYSGNCIPPQETIDPDDPCQGAIIQVGCDEAGSGIYAILNIVLTVLTVGVGIAAVAGMIFAALRYTQARDNVSATADARQMMLNILIGLIVWAIFYMVAQWLLPGGFF